VRFALGCCGESTCDVGPARRHLAQSVDGSSAYVWIRVVLEEVERCGNPEILAGAAFVLLAAVAGQRVKSASADAGILVVKGEDEFWQRFFVDESIKDLHALLPHDRLAMPETSAECRYRGRPRHQKADPRALAAG
jgi:hypothetical protein